jgi:hypothetical protein
VSNAVARIGAVPLKMVTQTPIALVLGHLTRLWRAHRSVAVTQRNSGMWKSRRKPLGHDFEFS